jgi:hypothetical protein
MGPWHLRKVTSGTKLAQRRRHFSDRDSRNAVANFAV